MENTEKFRMRKYSKQTATNIYAAPILTSFSNTNVYLRCSSIWKDKNESM